MLLIEVWRKLTPEERNFMLEERKREREKWKETVAELHRQIERVIADAIDAREIHRADIVRAGNDYLEACARHGRTMQALSRANAEHVQLVRALRALVDVCNERMNGAGGPLNNPKMGRATKEAEELLALVGIPF